MGPRVLVAIAGLYGAAGVALGAFGAHAWRRSLPPERLAHVDTAARYLFVAVPGLLITGVFAMECTGGPFEALAAWSFVLGPPLFSGSLLLLALSDRRGWGAVTPIGGALLIVGWLAVVGAALMLPGSAQGTYTLLSSGC